MLQICLPLILLLVLITNGVLLRRLLLKKAKTRHDKLLSILSLSNMGVEAFSSPSLLILVFITNPDVLCKILTINQVFLHLSMIFSWFMVIIIAIEMSLILSRIGQGRGGGEGQKAPSPPTSFSPVISTNVGLSPQIFLTFSFNPFATLV